MGPLFGLGLSLLHTLPPVSVFGCDYNVAAEAFVLLIHQQPLHNDLSSTHFIYFLFINKVSLSCFNSLCCVFVCVCCMSVQAPAQKAQIVMMHITCTEQVWASKGRPPRFSRDAAPPHVLHSLPHF